MTLMGTDGMDGLLSVEGFDTSLAEGVLLMTPFSADDEKNADFVKAYKDAYDETPNQFAADAYDCVHAIVEAIDKAGIDITADGADIAGRPCQGHAQDQDRGPDGRADVERQGPGRKARYGLCDSGRQVHRRLGAYKTRSVRLF